MGRGTSHALVPCIMKSPSPTWSACLLAALGSLLVHTSSARACEGEVAARWVPERAWPGACETDVPTNGLVFLEGAARDAATPGGEGELRVFVQRMIGEVPQETYEGTLTHPDATSAVFKSARPLAPNTDYQLTAQRVSQDGTPLSVAFTSDFTTGSGSVPAPSFRAQPTLQLEAYDKELLKCDADACGEKSCVGTGEAVPARFVRVAVPAIGGGLTQRPYKVSTRLTASFASGQAPVVATAEEATVQAGKRSYALVEVPSLSEAANGCVTVTATDIAGNTVTSESVCTALASDDGAEVRTEKAQEPAALVYGDAAEEKGAGLEPADSAGGCAIGEGRTSANGLAWLALALTLSRVRSRKRKA